MLVRSLNQRGDTISATQQWSRRVAARRQRSSSARPGRSQAGDTIVEVLMAIAIVSFVLVAAYVTANKNTLTNQDTQERGQATQLATTQLEFLRSGTVASGGCFDASGGATGGSNCKVKADGTPAAAGNQPAYTIAITGAGPTRKVQITWDSLLSGSTTDNVTLYYQP